MNPSLFGLISRAGALSLDELRARSAAGEAALARDIAAMLGEGVVEVATGQPRLAARLRGRNVAAIETALQSAFVDEGEADDIVIRPTTRGFRLMS